MSNEQNKRYREELVGLSHRMQEILDETAQAGEWTAEQRTNFDAADKRANELEAKISELEGDAQRAARVAELQSVDYRQIVQTGAPGEVENAEERTKAREEAYEQAFGRYMRGGLEVLTNEQRQLMLDNATEGRANDGLQSTTPGNIGGFLIPPGYRAVMTEAMKAYGGLINYANVITTSTGNPLQWPTNDDTGNVGAILSAEHTAVPRQEVIFGSKNIGAFTYTSKLVLVSVQLLQDSAFNLDVWLPRKLGERIGRAVAQHLITGSGSGEPEGVATNATNAVTAASGLTYDNLIDLEHSVDPAYRNGGACRFLFNDATLSVIRKLKDSLGRPLWLPVPVPGQPATVNGIPYTIDQGMPNIDDGNKSVLFGDFSRAYIVRQVLDTQMVRLTERFMDQLDVGYFGYMRLDAKADDPKAVRAIVHDVA